MGVSRATVLRGPAAITMGSQVLYTKGDIKVVEEIEIFEIRAAPYGKIADRLKDVRISLSFTPVGMFTAGIIAVTHPYTNPTNGASIYGASDVPVTLHPTNGKEKIVFTAGAVTKMAGLKLDPTQTVFKEMTIECLVKNAGDLSASDALFALTATEAFTDTSFALSSIPTIQYAASLAGASSPWDAIQTEDGWDIDFDLKLAPVRVSNYGLIDRSIQGLDVTAKCKPVGVTVADVLALMKIQGSGVRIGMDLSTGAADLTITGGATFPVVVVKNARLKGGGQIYGEQALRHDALTFMATRPTGGALWSLGVAV